MINKLLNLLLIVAVLFVIPKVLAHPGNTDSAGCHTCRTNCSSWGLSYGEYHCHTPKSYSPPPVIYTPPQPIYTPPPTCPIFSSYDSLSDSCECYSGYVAVGNECKSNQQYCRDTLGFSAQYNYGTGKCECGYGDIYISGSCQDADLYCSGQYGVFAEYNDTSNSCECRYGNVLNKAGSRCISKDQACHEQVGVMSSYNSLEDACECFTGYVISAGQCVLETPKVFAPPIIIKKPPVSTPVVIQTNKIVPTKKPIPSATISTEPEPTGSEELKNIFQEEATKSSEDQTSPVGLSLFWNWILSLFK